MGLSFFEVSSLIVAEFHIDAEFREPDVAAEVFWMGLHQQALESLELSREEGKMRTRVLIGRLSMVITDNVYFAEIRCRELLRCLLGNPSDFRMF